MDLLTRLQARQGGNDVDTPVDAHNRYRVTREPRNHLKGRGIGSLSK